MRLSRCKTRGLCGLQKPLGFGSFLLEQILADQNLHQFIPVNLTNHAPGTTIVGDVGRIFGQQVTNDLHPVQMQCENGQ